MLSKLRSLPACLHVEEPDNTMASAILMGTFLTAGKTFPLHRSAKCLRRVVLYGWSRRGLGERRIGGRGWVVGGGLPGHTAELLQGLCSRNGPLHWVL